MRPRDVFIYGRAASMKPDYISVWRRAGRFAFAVAVAGGSTLAIAQTPPAAPGGGTAATHQLIHSRFQSPALGKPLEYIVYYPPGYDPAGTKKYPVIYLLHGRGDNYQAWTQVAPDLDRMIQDHVIPPILAVLPDAPSSRRAGYYIDSEFTGGGDLPAGEKMDSAIVGDLVPHVDASYPTLHDRAHRLIGGYSMGGAGALRFALTRPDLFGAAIVLSPAVYVPLPPAHSSTREFGAYGRGQEIFDEARYQRENYPASLEKFRARDLPLYIYIAAGDQESAQADAAEAAHDLDYEAHILYNRLRRVPRITTAFRIVDGGHAWKTWQPTFSEGLRLAFASGLVRGDP